MRLRSCLLQLSIIGILAAGAQAQQLKVPTDLYRVDDEAAILDAARALINADKYAAFVTVDANGAPRARTVLTQIGPADPSRADKGFTIWIMTRRSTRKVEQIRKNPRVTLYYNDDAKESYVTIMGVATIHTDPKDPEAKKFYDEGYAKFFWPDLEKDFIMISVKPIWLEALVMPVIKNNRDNWRPQSVVFKY